MAEIIVSYLVQHHSGSMYGQRVLDNGQVENYLTTRMIKGNDGQYHNEKVTPGWYPIAQLSPAQVAAVQQAVTYSNLPHLGNNIPPDPNLKENTGERAQWQVQTPAGIKTVDIDHWAPVGDIQGPLRWLVERMGQIVIAAQSGSQDVP